MVDITYTDYVSSFFRFKVLNSLLEIESRPCVSHPLGSHLSFAKDKHGMAKAVLKMPYRRRQEDQPSVEYPSDMEEDRLETPSNNPPLSGKQNYPNGINLGVDLEIEDELKEIDNDMFAIPSKRSQKSNKNVMNQGYTSDFTTSVLGKYLNSVGKDVDINLEKSFFISSLSISINAFDYRWLRIKSS